LRLAHSLPEELDDAGSQVRHGVLVALDAASLANVIEYTMADGEVFGRQRFIAVRPKLK